MITRKNFPDRTRASMIDYKNAQARLKEAEIEEKRLLAEAKLAYNEHFVHQVNSTLTNREAFPVLVQLLHNVYSLKHDLSKGQCTLEDVANLVDFMIENTAELKQFNKLYLCPRCFDTYLKLGPNNEGQCSNCGYAILTNTTTDITAWRKIHEYLWRNEWIHTTWRDSFRYLDYTEEGSDEDKNSNKADSSICNDDDHHCCNHNCDSCCNESHDN